MTIPAVFKFINWITGTPVPIDDAMTSALTAPISTSLAAALAIAVPLPAVFLPAGATHTTGLVPDPGASAHTPPYFLMDDASFRNFVSQGYNLINGTIVETHAANAVTIAIKTLAGNDPSATDSVYVVFRNTTAGTGDYTILAITSAFSIVISSGSTLGATNATAFKIWLVCFNDAGTPRLGVINCRNSLDIYPLSAWQIATSTAEGGAGAADSAAVFYTGSAVAAKAYTILGYLSWETGLAAAGTWGASPTRIQIKNDNVPNPGDRVQIVQSVDAAVTTGATAIPYDNTIPQVGEGNQFMSKAITPTSATNLLELYGHLNLATNTSVIALAIFQDGANNAIFAEGASINSLNIMQITTFLHRMLAALSVSTTFTIRAGQSTANTTTFNGQAAGGIFGGVQFSIFVIEEIMT